MKPKIFFAVFFIGTLFISGNLASPSQLSNHDDSIVHPGVADQFDGHRGQKVSFSVNDSKGGASAFPCPDPTSISPCICSEYFNGLQLDCSDIESDDQLASIFYADFPVTSFWRFYIYTNINISRMLDYFNGISFEEITINFVSSLLSISGTAFVGSWNTLETLQITSSPQLNENTFPLTSLNRYRNLKEFILISSEIKNIPMINSTSIKSINLFDGAVSTLLYNTFHLLTNMSEISLSSHELQVLETSTFHLLNEHNAIDVNNNQIHTVQPGTFLLPQTTDSLTLHLSIHSNQLATLDQETWGDIMPYITLFEVNDNPLKCGCDMAWIITNSDYLSNLSDTASCADGTLLTDLDPLEYENLCNQRSDQTEAKKLIRHRLQPTV